MPVSPYILLYSSAVRPRISSYPARPDENAAPDKGPSNTNGGVHVSIKVRQHVNGRQQCLDKSSVSSNEWQRVATLVLTFVKNLAATENATFS